MTQEQTNKAPNYAAELLKGALAGGIATVPMTAFMLIAHRSLPFWQRSSLPPKKITMNIAHRIGLKKHMDEPQRRALTWAAHFAYGAGMGAIYAPLTRKITLPAALKGIAFGLVVWVASYLGGLPALAIRGAATDETAEQNALMIGAHVVWGSVAGIVTHLLEQRDVTIGI